MPVTPESSLFPAGGTSLFVAVTGGARRRVVRICSRDSRDCVCASEAGDPASALVWNRDTRAICGFAVP
jgi:hypothetical protein